MTNPASLNSYDKVPYHSYPYPKTRPENLKTIALLFGINAPEIETARVLELGCAEGNNLIPLATRYPKANFIGVDLSKNQIDAGNVHVQSLGLKNIELKALSITDIDKKFGKFDYIICHGVMSWVPDPVAEKILEITSKNLSENGIAYISYNTLPGWNMTRTVRDMMLYHSKNFSTPQEKINQSRLLLDFVKDSLDGEETPYTSMLKQETELLAKQPDQYILHDYLEEENKQFYFNKFVDRISKHDLQYLSDTSLSSMYLGNLPEKALLTLKDLNDTVRVEQYMDFISNRRFRCSLVCHKNVPINRNLSNDDIKKFTLSLGITPEKPLREVDLNDSTELKFFINNQGDNYILSTSPALKSIMYVFADNTENPLSFDDLVKKADKNLKNDMKAIIEQELIAQAMGLVLKGIINLSIEPGNKDKVNLKKPKLSEIALYQATKTSVNWVTNNVHKLVNVNVLDKLFMQYMDGTRDQEQIVSCLLADTKSGKITLNDKNNKKIQDEESIKKELETLYDSMIVKFNNQALLV